MSMLRPYHTLFIGMALGVFVLPRVLRAANVNLPGM